MQSSSNKQPSNPSQFLRSQSVQEAMENGWIALDLQLKTRQGLCEHLERLQSAVSMLDLIRRRRHHQEGGPKVSDNFPIGC